MRAKFLIRLITVAIIGLGYAPLSAAATQEIYGYWKPPKDVRFTVIGIGLYRDAFRNPDDIFYNNCVDFIKKKKFSQAISQFDQLLNKNRNYGEAYLARGLAYALEGKYEAAIADFSRYLEFDKQDADCYYNRGLARVLQGQYDQGLADLNQALTLKPDDYLALYLRGFVQFKQGRAAAAKADYEKALHLNPDFGEREGKGQTELDTYPLILQGKTPAPAGPGAPAGAGAAHKKQALAAALKGDYDMALAEFSQAIQTDPKDPELYNNRGGIYTFKGRYDLALADFNKALQLKPRYANAYYNRGVAYYNQKLYDKAIADFNKSLELDPKLADAYFNKALALEAAGRQDEAREAYGAFLKHAPPEAREQIEQARRGLQK
jgi:tetratricopeptide (TPR) repeat protein